MGRRRRCRTAIWRACTRRSIRTRAKTWWECSGSSDRKYALDLIYISGPGHGAPATLSNSYLEGVYSEVYPDKSEDVVGMQRFFRSEVCAGFDLYFRAGTWGAGDAVEQLSGGRVLGGLSGQERRRGGNAAVLQAVLVSGRDWQPLHAGDAGVDPRRRRVGLQPVAWVWRGVRQPGPDCCGGGGRWRVGDRATRLNSSHR